MINVRNKICFKCYSESTESEYFKRAIKNYLQNKEGFVNVKMIARSIDIQIEQMSQHARMMTERMQRKTSEKYDVEVSDDRISKDIMVDLKMKKHDEIFISRRIVDRTMTKALCPRCKYKLEHEVMKQQPNNNQELI